MECFNIQRITNYCIYPHWKRNQNLALWCIRKVWLFFLKKKNVKYLQILYKSNKDTDLLCLFNFVLLCTFYSIKKEISLVGWYRYWYWYWYSLERVDLIFFFFDWLVCVKKRFFQLGTRFSYHDHVISPRNNNIENNIRKENGYCSNYINMYIYIYMNMNIYISSYTIDNKINYKKKINHLLTGGVPLTF